MPKNERGEQFMRVWKVLQRLEMNRYGMTADELARELGYSKRTIYRDLELIQKIGFPLDKFKKNDKVFWSVTDEFKKVNIPFTLPELMALHYSRGLFEPLHGTPVRKAIDSALDKIYNYLPPEMRDEVYSAEKTFISKAKPGKDYARHSAIISTLSSSAIQKRKCSVHYQVPGRSSADEHVFHAYALTFYDGLLYAVGFSELRKAIRIFAVDRVRKAVMLEHKFEMPKDSRGERFDVDEYMRQSWGISHEGDIEEVRLRFSKRISPMIAERVWHHSQKLRTLNNGELEFTLKVTGIKELMGWVLSFGSDVSVIEPFHLREKIKDIAEEIQKIYAK